MDVSTSPTQLVGWVLDIHAYQLLLDAILICFSIYVLIQKPDKPEKPLTAEEMDEIIKDWEPVPLAPPKRTPLQLLNEKVPLITGTTTTHVTIDGKQVLNVARTNFLGFVANAETNKAAKEAVQKYGVGTCGPRGFYGTIDVHLTLEEKIKNFMNAEDCLIYSYGFATVSSVIPAFTGQGDLLIVDKGVSFAIQTGLKLSRSTVKWFEHNNMQDLERILEAERQTDLKTKRPLTRRFIIVEGVYYNYGDVAPLDKIMELKRKYFYRIILDDSYGVGVLGKTGRGTCEHFGVDVKEIDMLTANLESTVSSVGGFCCGSKSVVYHQRLNSSGFVYSASLPPLLTKAAETGFELIDQKPELRQDFIKNLTFVYDGLSKLEGFKVTSTKDGTVIHLRLKNPPSDRYQNEKILQDVVDFTLDSGILITRAKYVDGEAFLPPPSIRICVSAAHSKEDLSNFLKVMKEAASFAISNQDKTQ